MKYYLKISGGFLGTIQEFQGELIVTSLKEKSIKRILNKSKSRYLDKKARDIFVYDFSLEFGKESYKVTYDDTTIPDDLMNLVKEIKKNEQ